MKTGLHRYAQCLILYKYVITVYVLSIGIEPVGVRQSNTVLVFSNTVLFYVSLPLVSFSFSGIQWVYYLFFIELMVCPLASRGRPLYSHVRYELRLFAKLIRPHR